MEYNKRLFSTLESIVKKYDELNNELENSSVSHQRIAEINKELKKTKEIKEAFLPFRMIINDGLMAEKILETEKDKEMLEFARTELSEAKLKIKDYEDKLQILLLPKDPHNNRNIIVEMRPAAGGDESSIFVGDLFETYSKFCENQNWKLKIIESENSTFGFSYIYFSVKGNNVYEQLKYESGVHRVQRIPATESKGRVHTSTITVVVMPEIDDVEVKINHEDLRIDTFRSSGKGGQAVNKVESAVRIVHVPTGIEAVSQSENSQLENRAIAMELLKTKLWKKAEDERKNLIDSTRKEAVGTGERSEKIRTYNYPQNRVTDHRIGLSLNKLDYIMTGHLEEIIDALIRDEQIRLLEELKI